LGDSVDFSGVKIKQLREARSWTRQELAERIVATGHFSGFTHQRVTQLESSDNASHRALVALCAVFEVTPGAFFEK
jgi:transcriptional regulator with XRE-family HTH domain